MMNTKDFLQHDTEVFTFWRPAAERTWHILPHHESWSDVFSRPTSLLFRCAHLLDNTDLLHKKTGAGAS